MQSLIFISQACILILILPTRRENYFCKTISVPKGLVKTAIIFIPSKKNLAEGIYLIEILIRLFIMLQQKYKKMIYAKSKRKTNIKGSTFSQICFFPNRSL